MDKLCELLLPIDLVNDNAGRSQHWSKAAKRKKQYVEMVWWLTACRREPFTYRVRLRITRILGKGQRLWDPCSIGRGSAKELIDALVDNHYLVDDGPKYVIDVDYRQDATKRENGPAVLVEFFE